MLHRENTDGKRRKKMATLNDPHLDFFQALQNLQFVHCNTLTISLVLYLSNAQALCDRYQAQIRPKDVFRKPETKILEIETVVE